MKSILYSILLLLLSSSYVKAQVLFGPIPNKEQPIRVNNVQNMRANGDTLWIGPIMNSNIGGDTSWRIPTGADSVLDGRGRMFSIYAKGKQVLAGIATNSMQGDASVPTAMGFYTSNDGGNAWQWIDHPLQSQDDTLFTYGAQSYSMLPVIVPEQSPSYEVAFKGNRFFSANWATGLLRSLDSGTTWERLILPPINVDEMRPDESYVFYRAAGDNQPDIVRDYDPRPNNALANNYLGYSVLIDKFDRVWVGTAGGFNISENALFEDRSSIIWRHYATALNTGLMLGNWVITMVEDPEKDRVWMTNWATSNTEQEGIIQVSHDLSFSQRHLIGERIYDISIKGDTVLAVGDNGLFISPDYGRTWINRRQISSPNSFIRSNARFQATDVTTDGTMWVGTSDGIASSKDLLSWDITRVDVPLNGENPYGEQPSVSSYPYPNPFSPRLHQQVRIKFELKGDSEVVFEVFDASMRKVHQQNLGSYAAGTYEAIWDGTDQNGYQVNNGVYLYAIQQGNSTIKGKVVVIQ